MVPRKYSIFGILFTASLLMGWILIALLLYFIYIFKEGLAWTHGTKLFDFHILLMPLGLTVLYGTAMLIYRAAPTSWPRPAVKWIHTILMALAFISSVVGLQAVFLAHGMKGIPALYTLHSWIGLVTVILFAAQLLGGFTVFLYPGLTQAYRRLILPYHTWSGVVIFILSFVSVISGLTEHIVFREYNEYKKRRPFGVFGNVIGIVVVMYTVLVLFLVLLPFYNRRTQPTATPMEGFVSETPISHPDTLYSKLATDAE